MKLGMKWLRVALEVMGALSLLAVVVVGSWTLYSSLSNPSVLPIALRFPPPRNLA